jgi:hypothetical protein
MITYKYYLPNSYNRNPNAEHLLIKYIDHEHCDLGEEDINIHSRTAKDEFEFAISFYNGGTDALEIYEDIIDKFDLDAEYKDENETININIHEANMIIDMAEFVLNMLPNHDEYLYGEHSNYSKEEISNLKQQLENNI